MLARMAGSDAIGPASNSDIVLLDIRSVAFIVDKLWSSIAAVSGILRHRR